MQSTTSGRVIRLWSVAMLRPQFQTVAPPWQAARVTTAGSIL
jgi:hypothetical protein